MYRQIDFVCVLFLKIFSRHCHCWQRGSMCLQCTVVWWTANLGSSRGYKLCVGLPGLCLSEFCRSCRRAQVSLVLFWTCTESLKVHSSCQLKYHVTNIVLDYNVFVVAVQPLLSSLKQTRHWLIRLCWEMFFYSWRRAFWDARLLPRKSFISAASIHSSQTSWHLCQWR